MSVWPWWKKDYQMCIRDRILCVFFILAGKKIKKADPKQAPKGFLLVCESVANLGTNIIGDNLKERTRTFLPFFGTLIFMMAPSNLLGLIGLQPPTSNLSVNAVSYTHLCAVTFHSVHS